jgi:hypothetical protein
MVRERTLEDPVSNSVDDMLACSTLLGSGERLAIKEGRARNTRTNKCISFRDFSFGSILAERFT